METTNEAVAADSRGVEEIPMATPHAFHQNLPSHHFYETTDDDDDGDHNETDVDCKVPYITKFAHKKARAIVQLCHSIQLSNSLFEQMEDDEIEAMQEDTTNNAVDDGEDGEDMVVEDDRGDDDDIMVDSDNNITGEDPHAFPSKMAKSDSLAFVIKKCFRLSSQVVSWEGFKYGGISVEERARMILHMLRLVTACLIRKPDGTVELVYEKSVGYLMRHGDDTQEDTGMQRQQQKFERATTTMELKEDLKHPFALPSPARESLLSVLCQLFSDKGALRSASNSALFLSSSSTTTEKQSSNSGMGPSLSLILHWQVMLRLLLRTAPYLDPYEAEFVPRDSSSRVSTVQKRTVQLIRDSRRFFSADPETASQIWSMVRTDVLFHSHTHACYRGTILLYLLLPSRCAPEFYQNVLPDWLEAWTNIDRCPEFDFLWLALFCRSRKYLTRRNPNNDEQAPVERDWTRAWRLIRRRLLTLCQYWCLLPIGGTTTDKSWTQAPHPRSRACPSKLKALANAGSSYEEGIDFVAKIAKLLVASLGDGSTTIDMAATAPSMSEGTADILRFFSYVAPYFHPSNLGSWTFTLGAFLHYFCYELACRMGTAAGLRVLRRNYPAVCDSLAKSQPGTVANTSGLPAHEVVALMHALVPLCQQALYSKNAHVSRASEAAMLYLVQIDPRAVAPSFCDFGMRALDVTAVNSAHQAPAALSAMARLVQPMLRRAPEAFLTRLPTILQLTLAGIDSNDQNKTIRTLIFYRSLSSWIPIGGNYRKMARAHALVSGGENVLRYKGATHAGANLMEEVEIMRNLPEYKAALAALPANSLLHRGDEAEGTTENGLDDMLLDQVSSATSDWALAFLERLFELLRVSGEREKAGKRSSGVASRHSTADVHQARNFSRVLKESCTQLFMSMDSDTFQTAARTVIRFVEEETLPSAAKDASYLCQSVAAARGEGQNPGLDMLVPILTNDLRSTSVKTAVYRVRCLAGSVRFAGLAILNHRKAISSTLDLCFKSKDRHLFKTGCKLLRHTLSTLTEPYPLPIDSKPRIYSLQNGKLCLGRSAELANDPVEWHVPNGECVEYAWYLLSKHVVHRLDDLSSPEQGENGMTARSRMLSAGNIQDIRRCLRLVRYSIRGGAGLLVDEEVTSLTDIVPHEKACHRLIEQCDTDVRDQILHLRSRFCAFLVVLASIISSDTLHPGGLNEIPEKDSYHKTLPLISRDPKICKETCDIALLLLTRRGASFRSQEAMTVWKAQKQLSNDYTLSAQVDTIVEALQSAGLYGQHVLYKDGEDGGKSIPRRVAVTRVHLFHSSMIRNASFEIPRRMRRMGRDSIQREILFNAKGSLPEMLSNLESVLTGNKAIPLDGYEGILDGLHALCCHSNTQVRASAIGVIEYALTRFGWLLRIRINRLLSAIALHDKDQNGKFGIPSCCGLTEQFSNQGKRKRLAEAMKGVCSILALQRTTKFVLGSHKLRVRFMKTICETDELVSLMPAEEMQKMIHYVHSIFSPFRSKLFNLPRASKHDVDNHRELLQLSLDFLSEGKRQDGDSDESPDGGGKAEAHWRRKLTACWFLLVFIDLEDIAQEPKIVEASWKTCFRMIENEKGQPLQRVALGLLGKLSFLSKKSDVAAAIGEKLKSQSFCGAFADALVYDHKEDSSFGGGHEAQWSAGVEDFIREAARFVARRNVFPFQRSNLGSGSFKVVHCQLVEHILSCLSQQEAEAVVEKLLGLCKEMLSAPPNEDQKNQQVTSAEIFAGACRFYVTSGMAREELWAKTIIPFFDDAMGKLPFALTSAYSDALRFSLQFCNPSLFQPLTEFIVDKISKSLWQMKQESSAGNSPTSASNLGADGFNAQSKWLYLISSLLVELDISESDGVEGRTHWYTSFLVDEHAMVEDLTETTYSIAWTVVREKLLPLLLDALGHPFHSCRDHISRLLFRICSCYRKRHRTVASRAPSRSNSTDALASMNIADDDPGHVIVQKLSLLHKDESLSFLDKYNSLSTTRRFLSYCLHLGEAKFELTDFVIPALPAVFEGLKSTVEDCIAKKDGISQEDEAAWRALEAEVTKGFRYSVSEISMTPTSPDREADIGRILGYVEDATRHDTWQVRAASAQFLRCFQGAHKFLSSPEDKQRTMAAVANLLSDDRREVCSAAMAALTGLLSGLSMDEVAELVNKYVAVASRSKMKRKKVVTSPDATILSDEKEVKRSRNQQTSVYFLCAAVMARPYDTPPYVPVALSAISKHSFERSAPLSVRDTVKRCCAEYKRTHMSDNWEEHKSAFSQEQMDALEDVVSTPHYYA
mmetsp:Transcript_5490/g.15486  ORF Transcript_5490/g.15486 Transcript_5490/m.15486 type:complete len:2289 (+) Transcript_5490:225-7091(+)